MQDSTSQKFESPESLEKRMDEKEEASANPKYGFLTTYRETVLLKQEEYSRRQRHWVMLYSSVIERSTMSTLLAFDDPNGIALYRKGVSLRKCLSFIVHRVSWKDLERENAMPRNQWYNHDQDDRDDDDDDDDDDSIDEPSGDSSGISSASGQQHYSLSSGLPLALEMFEPKFLGLPFKLSYPV